MKEEFSSVLVTEDDIRNRVRQMGVEISDFYCRLGAEELTVVAVLRGAVVFMSDLIRSIDLPMRIDFMSVSSYGDGAVSSGKVRILKDIGEDIRGKHVLIVEDIIDTGLTIASLKEILKEREPRTLKICAFLNKPSRREVELSIDFKGFDVPDEFLVGYGLDYAGYYRELPFVAVLDPKVYNP